MSPLQPKPKYHCPACGYTAADAAMHMDHHLCEAKSGKPDPREKNKPKPEIDYKAEVLKKFPNYRVWRGWKGPEFVGTMVSGEDNGYPEIGHGRTEAEAIRDAYEKHCKPVPVSMEVSAEAERLQAQRDSMDATIPFAELYERSKDDRAFIASSEVREVIGAYRRCLQQLGREQPTLPPMDEQHCTAPEPLCMVEVCREAAKDGELPCGEHCIYGRMLPPKPAQKYCIPGDSKPMWLLQYSDPEKGYATYDTEAEALAAFEHSTVNWNCRLFAPALRSSAEPAQPVVELPEDNDPPDCERCKSSISLHDGYENTGLCDECAQALVPELRAALQQAEQQRDRAISTKNVSYQETICCMCLVRKHTPVRCDDLGGYICGGCLENAYYEMKAERDQAQAELTTLRAQLAEAQELVEYWSTAHKELGLAFAKADQQIRTLKGEAWTASK